MYPHWRDTIYPAGLPQRLWLQHYATNFSTVEINNSFYRLPGANAFESWRDQVPKGFVYAVKASRFLTHMKKLKDPEESLGLLFERIVHLGSALGPVLYQLPPHWRVDRDRLERFLKALPDGYRHAIEFREPSWISEDVFRLLQDHNVAHCIHDLGGTDIPRRVTSPFTYVRFHGGSSHGGNYPNNVLESWADQIRTWEAQGIGVYAYFNNDVGGHAVRNAQTLVAKLYRGSHGSMIPS
jgi:uncharacterized protein YecE (DUF72 family)